jgi:hypothetical protein
VKPSCGSCTLSTLGLCPSARIDSKPTSSRSRKKVVVKAEADLLPDLSSLDSCPEIEVGLEEEVIKTEPVAGNDGSSLEGGVKEEEEW